MLLEGLLLALAIGSKVFAIVLIPLLLGLQWRAWLSFFMGILLITAPFLSIEPWVPEGLGEMARQWLFNAPIYMLLFPVLPPVWVKTSLGVDGIAGCAVVLYGGFESGPTTAECSGCRRIWSNLCCVALRQDSSDSATIC